MKFFIYLMLFNETLFQLFYFFPYQLRLWGCIISQYDIFVNVNGGGLSGQAEAIRMGISRGLQEIEPNLRTNLKKAGFLKRDSREVERKKYGQPGARKKFQFSKR